MLTCISCSKQTEEDGRGEEGSGGGARGTPSTKEAVKSLTAQVLILHPPSIAHFAFSVHLLSLLCQKNHSSDERRRRSSDMILTTS